MKKLILLMTVCVTATAFSQTPNPRIPSTPHNPNQKPIPEIKPVIKLPDLSVAFIDVISASYYAEKASGSTKLSIKISNTGAATSPATEVVLKIYTDAFDGSDHVLWQAVGEPFAIPALTPGQTITRFAIFDSEHFRKKTYRSKLEINVGGVITETSLTNNRSAEFNLTFE
jgi:hypothetical protein